MNILSKTAFVTALFMLVGCREYGIQLRIENGSQHVFEQVTVNNVSFGSLAPNEVSTYIPFESIYESEFVEVIVNSRAYRLVPEQYNIDEFYDSGNFKYVIDVTQNHGLNIRFVVE